MSTSLPQRVPGSAPPSKVTLSFDEISKLFSLPIAEAASILGVCTSVLKRICRENGIVRWPYRKFLAGKTVEDIRRDAEREKTKELNGKFSNKKSDASAGMPSSSVGLSSTFGEQAHSRTPDLAQEASKSQEGITMPGNVLQPQGNRFMQSGSPNILQYNQGKNIPTYMDELKFGFPAKGLSSVSLKWWGNNSPAGTATEKDEGQESCELSNDTSQCMMDDEPDSSAEDSATTSEPSALLCSLRRKAVEDGRELLKCDTSKGGELYNLSKKQKLVLLQVFRSSLPERLKINIS
ncbi:uncharacterized protein [Typha angustifolia]|uniref:uncharacterized protein n=1 Tax=Typha angustifolia TaxID=59011 RepID=UPI003C2DC566